MDTEAPIKWPHENNEDTLDVPVAFVFYMHGVPGAVFLAQLCKWSLEQGELNQWFTKSLEDWKSKAAIGKRRVAKYTKELTAKGVLETRTERSGKSCETFYKLDESALVAKVLDFEAKRKG